MLYLILARAGGGKTTHITELIDGFSAAGKKITLIVPEQFSFMSEKTMLGRMGAERFAGIDVLSFTSLAEKLVGKPAFHERRRLDEPAKAALMSFALEAVKDKLNLYSEHTERSSVIEEFVSLASEFKQSAVPPEQLALAAAEMEDCLLKSKLADISLTLEAYNALVGSSYFDPDDLLGELNELLPESDYFADRLVFIDSFRGFTAQEHKVIEHMLRRSPAVYVTLCTEDLSNMGDETDLFAHTKRTAAKLIESAKRNSVAVAKPQYLSKRSKFNNFPPHFRRYAAPELAALEQELFSPSPNVYEDDCPGITLCRAEDIYAECEFIACTAKKLMRENGLRSRDIAVIATDSAAYEAPLRSALRKCGISVFEDSRRPVDASPIVALVLSAAQIACKGFDTEAVMRYLKTELAGLSVDETAEVENYCYLWQINYGDWLHEWDKNPSGFGEFTDSDAEELQRLNELRLRIISPLCRLRDKLAEGLTGGEAAQALLDLLEGINAPENIRLLARRLAEQGEEGMALELDRIWELLMDMLDSLETVSRDRVLSPKKFFDLLKLMLNIRTVGSLPQGLDEVTIGSADRIRVASPKAVFIAGANAGVFPAGAASGSALTDNDRRRLLEMGIELASFGEYQLAESKLIAYSALCCAGERLYICCPERGSQGEQLAPSELYVKIKTLFPACREIKTDGADDLYYIEGRELAFERLAKTSDPRLRASLLEYFGNDGEYAGRISALERAGGMRNFAVADRSAAEALFGRDMNISASRVESYYKCPFSYFCRYGLKAMPRKIAELDPMQRGNVIHHVLEELLRSYPQSALSAMCRDELYDIIYAIMEEYLMRVLDGKGRSERFLYLYKKLASAVCDVAERLIKELSQSDFRPVEFEMKIGPDGKLPSYELSDPEGRIRVFGAVDRVDIAEIDGKRYFRIIDYKSSGKDFRLSDVMQGLNMQMFIYLFAIWQSGRGELSGAMPAGVLYYPANSPMISAPRDEDEEKTALDIQKKCRMQGIVLSDCDVVIAMDRSASGLYIPVDFKKGEMSGSLIGLSQLAKLKEKADGLLLQMAEQLRGGEISALPAEGRSYKEVCKYCDYKTVCAYEDGIPVRALSDDKLADVLAALSKGDENDEVD